MLRCEQTNKIVENGEEIFSVVGGGSFCNADIFII